MGHRVTDMSRKSDYNDGMVWCDFREDLDNVDKTNLEQGTMAYIQAGEEKGNVYSLLSTKEWERQQPCKQNKHI